MSHIGEHRPRVEDFRLLTGAGEFSDDLNRQGQAYMYVLRAEPAHARILSIDTAAARAAPGVLAVLTGSDYIADGIEPLRHRGNPPDVELKNRSGAPIFQTPYYPVVTDKVRRSGEAVAIVVAESLAQAKDAAETIAVEYDVLDAVASIADALAEGAPKLWDEVPGNLIVDALKGDVAAVDAAFSAAAHVVRIETFNNRVTGVPMEPRAAIGEYDPAADQYSMPAARA